MKSSLMKMLLIASALSASLCTGAPALKVSARQDDRTRDVTAASKAVSIDVGGGRRVKLYEKSYALVIGASEYAQGWPKLPGVKRDVEEVARALERQGFQVTVVMNPDATLLEKSFRDFIAEHGMEVENRLLVYFAGHGHTLKQSYGDEMGYIVPVDAPRPEGDAGLAGFRTKAMSMRRVELYAEEIQAKHALFLFDSCFSGSLFVMRSGAVPESISSKTALPVRQFITSGSADEKVPDESVFRRQFVEAIGGAADLNPRDGYVTGSELGGYLYDKVVNSSRLPQHPQFGTIRNASLNRGDFVFSLPNAPRPPASKVSASLRRALADTDVEAIVKEILDRAGLNANFTLVKQDVMNAYSVVNEGERLLVYDPVFLAGLKNNVKTDWAPVFVLAHEIGHHLLGHTLNKAVSADYFRASELEADQFAGFTLQRLGATLDEAQATLKILEVRVSADRPPTEARLNAVAVGWRKAQEQSESN